MAIPARRMDEIGISVPRKLAPFLQKKKRFKIAYGGRGGAKSVTFANLFTMFATSGVSIGCFREYQNSIDESVYSLLKQQIQDLNIPGYSMNKAQIDHASGGGFRFKGLARSIESVKSMHGFTYFWLEEGQFISSESLKILTPTLREKDSELWVSANPLNSADPFSQQFIVPFQKELDRNGYYEDDLHLIVKINWRDNPWFPEVLEQERQHDYLNLPRAMYDHIWEGAFNDSIADSIISTEWFDAAVNAHEKLGIRPTGAIVVSHDPSDLGTDEKGLVVRHGSLVLAAESRSFGDVNEGCDWALDRVVDTRANIFVWDADGMGVGLKRQVEKSLYGKGVEFIMFKGSESPERPNDIYEPLRKEKDEKTNQDLFKNRRAQNYWYLRDRFFSTYLAVEKGQYMDPDKIISISPDIVDLPMLRSEVCRIPRKYNSQGKIQIMTKVEMAKLKIRSPNLADSLMMSLSTEAELFNPPTVNPPIVPSGWRYN